MQRTMTQKKTLKHQHSVVMWSVISVKVYIIFCYKNLVLPVFVSPRPSRSLLFYPDCGVCIVLSVDMKIDYYMYMACKYTNAATFYLPALKFHTRTNRMDNSTLALLYGIIITGTRISQWSVNFNFPIIDLENLTDSQH